MKYVFSDTTTKANSRAWPRLNKTPCSTHALITTTIFAPTGIGPVERAVPSNTRQAGMCPPRSVKSKTLRNEMTCRVAGLSLTRSELTGAGIFRVSPMIQLMARGVC